MGSTPVSRSVHATRGCQSQVRQWPASHAIPPNVIPQSVCDMDTFHGAPPGQVPDGWTEFILSGNPSFAQDADTYFGEPSLRIRTFDECIQGGHLHAGSMCSPAPAIAPVSPGVRRIRLIPLDRQLGLDPTGGTDPNSPTIIWGPMHWGPARILNYPPPDVNIDVQGTRGGDSMTVFFLVDHIRQWGRQSDFHRRNRSVSGRKRAGRGDTTNGYASAHPHPRRLQPRLSSRPRCLPRRRLFRQPPLRRPPIRRRQPIRPLRRHTDTPLPTATPTATPTWTPWPVATEASGLAAPGRNRARSAGGPSQRSDRVRPQALIVLGILGFGSASLFGGSLLFLRRKR